MRWSRHTSVALLHIALVLFQVLAFNYVGKIVYVESAAQRTGHAAWRAGGDDAEEEEDVESDGVKFNYYHLSLTSTFQILFTLLSQFDEVKFPPFSRNLS